MSPPFLLAWTLLCVMLGALLAPSSSPQQDTPAAVQGGGGNALVALGGPAAAGSWPLRRAAWPTGSRGRVSYLKLHGCTECESRQAELAGRCSNYAFDMRQRAAVAGGGRLRLSADLASHHWICKLHVLTDAGMRFPWHALRAGQTVNQLPRVRLEVFPKRTLCRHMTAMWGAARHSFFAACFNLPEQADELLQWQAATLPGEGSGDDGSADVGWALKASESSGGRGVSFHAGHLRRGDLSTAQASYAQWFIAPPALLLGHKFDLRLYAIATSFDPMRLYLYSRGYSRRAAAAYTPGQLSAKAMHVVNHQFSVDYLRDHAAARMTLPFPPGSDESDARSLKWSLRAVMRHAEAAGVDSAALWSRIASAITRTLLSVSSALSCRHAETPYPCGTAYQLFGMDIMLDAAWQPYVLEANTQPDMYRDSSTMARIQGDMVSDVWAIMGVIPYALAVNETALDAWLHAAGLHASLTAPQRLSLSTMLQQHIHRGGFDLAFPISSEWPSLEEKAKATMPTQLASAFFSILQLPQPQLMALLQEEGDRSWRMD